MSIFENAARSKFRFPTVKGAITPEQLWDLPLTSKTGFDLDTVAKAVNADLKAQAEESFVDTSSNPVKGLLESMLAVVVRVIEVKQAENEKARTAAAKKAERERLVEVLHLRTQDDLMKKSPAEIQAMIDSLNA